MRKRKPVFIMIATAAVIILAATIVFLYYYRMAGRLAAERNALEETIQAYEDANTLVYILTDDVRAGQLIRESDYLQAYVQKAAIPQNIITDASELEGKIYKTGLAANTYLTEDLLLDMMMSDDMRELDVVMTEVPIGLAEGDYIDVRIAYPMGQDFIAMSHKKVVALNGNAVKLVVGERDFYAYESMKADYGSYQAVKIYGAKYVEAGIQAAAAVYYPVSADILKTEISDPNIDTADYSDILKRRKILEEQLIAADLVEKNSTVTSNKERLDELFREAENAYARMQEEKERQAEEGAAPEADLVPLN